MKHFSEVTPAGERVLDVAEELIARRGYNGFSYDDIAKRIGIKKPSIHHHFPTKAELVAVMAQRYTHRFRGALLEIEGRQAVPHARLMAYADLFERTHLREREFCVCGILGAEAETLPAPAAEEVSRFFTLNLDWLGAVFKQGAEEGSLRLPAPAPVHAEGLLALLEGSMLLARGLRQSTAGGAGPVALAAAYLTPLQPL